MASFMLVHPAWLGGWCWRKLAPLLREPGHQVHTPTLTLPIMGWTPVKPDLELADGDLLDGVLRVVHVPGHTAGHIALLHEPSRTVLVGDALFHRSGLTLGPAALAEDPAGRPAGLRALPPDVAAVGFAHGAPLSGTATEIYQQFLHERSAT